MEATVHPVKKKSAGKVVFWIFSPFLLVLALVVLALGALVLFGFTYDDPAALLAQAPMSAQDRYVFHAAQRTVDVAVDVSDILFILSQEGELTPAALQAQLKESGVDLPAYGLTLEKYGIDFDEGASVTLLFKWLGFLPIPLKLDADATVANGELNLVLTKVHVTKLIALSAQTLGEKLGFDAQQLSYQISLKELNTWLSAARSVSFSNGKMELTCGIGEELFAEVRADAYFAQNAVYYIDSTPEHAIFLNAFSEKGNTLSLGSDFTALLETLEGQPGMIEQVRLNCLSLAYPYHANQAFEGAEGEYLTRFLPNVTKEAVAARHAEQYSLYQDRFAFMSRFIQGLNNLYQNKKISYSDGSLIDAATGEPLALSHIVEDYPLYEDFLRQADSRLMLCSGNIQGMAYGFDTPLKKMPHDKDATYPGLDKDQVYMVLLLTRMKTGQPAYVFLTGKLTAVIINLISEQEYRAYMESAVVPSIVLGG